MIYVVGMAAISLWTTWMTIKHQAPHAAAYVMLCITLFCAVCQLQPRANHHRGIGK